MKKYMPIPKITVILPTMNDEKFVSATVESFVNQTYTNKELVVIDGFSKDNTVKIIKKSVGNRVKVVIAKPQGISDAFNQGIEISNGDYLYFMGAGDVFEDSQALENLVKDTDPKLDWLVVGQIRRIKQNGEVIYTTTNNFQKWQLLYKMAIPHQGLLTSKYFFEKFGLFDTSCRFAMDYDLLLRAFHDFPKVVQKDVVVARWMEGGVGQNETAKVIEEYQQIRTKNKIAPRWLLNLIYYLSKWRYGIR